MVIIELDFDLEERLTELARRSGQPVSAFPRRLIDDSLDDRKDFELAEARFERGLAPLTMAQVRLELGLDR